RAAFKGDKGGPPAPPAPPGPMKAPEYVVRGAQGMTKATATLAPLVFTLERKPDALVLEARQPALRGASTRVINVWLDTMLQRSVYREPAVRKDVDFQK